MCVSVCVCFPCSNVKKMEASLCGGISVRAGKKNNKKNKNSGEKKTKKKNPNSSKRRMFFFVFFYFVFFFFLWTKREREEENITSIIASPRRSRFRSHGLTRCTSSTHDEVAAFSPSPTGASSTAATVVVVSLLARRPTSGRPRSLLLASATATATASSFRGLAREEEVPSETSEGGLAAALARSSGLQRSSLPRQDTRACGGLPSSTEQLACANSSSPRTDTDVHTAQLGRQGGRQAGSVECARRCCYCCCCRHLCRRRRRRSYAERFSLLGDARPKWPCLAMCRRDRPDASPALARRLLSAVPAFRFVCSAARNARNRC